MTSARTWSTAFVALFLLGTLSLTAQTEQRTHVEKSISSNPSIAILRFDGSAEMRRKLEEILYRCGWFKGASRPENADVKLQGRSLASGQLETYVEGLGRAFSTRYSGDGNMAVYQTVDEILNRLFNVPGLCTRKIYFVQSGNQNMKEIFACYLDGTGQERVTFNNAISTEPGWGHGNALVYTLARQNALSVVLVDMALRRQKIVSSTPGLNSSPSLYYDGTRLALPLSIGNQVDLYVINLKNGARTRVTQDKNVESSPAWSKDGSKLCFVSDKFGVPRLFMKDLKSGQETCLTRMGRECVSPDWSPVCNRICFSMRQADGQRVLAVINMSDAKYEAKVITTAPGNWEAPSWGPDGRHVVCIRTLPGEKGRDLCIVDSWSGEYVQVSKGAKLALPAWRPAF